MLDLEVYLREVFLPLCLALVDHPEELVMTSLKTKVSIIIEITPSKADVGQLLGRQGRNIDCVRVLAQAVAAKHKQRVIIQVLE